jgi:hypothetical protein
MKIHNGKIEMFSFCGKSSFLADTNWQFWGVGQDMKQT